MALARFSCSSVTSLAAYLCLMLELTVQLGLMQGSLALPAISDEPDVARVQVPGTGAGTMNLNHLDQQDGHQASDSTTAGEMAQHASESTHYLSDLTEPPQTPAYQLGNTGLAHGQDWTVVADGEHLNKASPLLQPGKSAKDRVDVRHQHKRSASWKDSFAKHLSPFYPRSPRRYPARDPGHVAAEAWKLLIRKRLKETVAAIREGVESDIKRIDPILLEDKDNALNQLLTLLEGKMLILVEETAFEIIAAIINNQVAKTGKPKSA